MADETSSDESDVDQFSEEYIEDDYDAVELSQPTNIEEYEFKMLSKLDTRKLLDATINDICHSHQLSSGTAKVLLYQFKWDSKYIHNQLANDKYIFLTACNVSLPEDTYISEVSSVSTESKLDKSFECAICLTPKESLISSHRNSGLHQFCLTCWFSYIKSQLEQRIAINIECPASNCKKIVSESFVENILNDTNDIPSSLVLEKYKKYLFEDLIASHPNMRFCCGENCEYITWATEPQPKKVTCSFCDTSYCFLCGVSYHIPTTCEEMSKWLKKSKDDSETAHYIQAKTKDCPKCAACIEKNGGCNHMQCQRCKHHFCWVCLGDWETHRTDFYRCSLYPEGKKTSKKTQSAREALAKYLHYYERWFNHARSLSFENDQALRHKAIVEERLQKREGTWIDWEPLLRASQVLTLSRYTLQYSYPHAYFMESETSQKGIFEQRQADLEVAVEALAWQVEHIERDKLPELVRYMDCVERQRCNLLIFDFSIIDNNGGNDDKRDNLKEKEVGSSSDDNDNSMVSVKTYES